MLDQKPVIFTYILSDPGLVPLHELAEVCGATDQGHSQV